VGMADEVGQRLSDAMHCLAMPLNMNELAHIGIALFHSDDKSGEILADADAALASAKTLSVNGYAVQSKKSEALGNDAWKILIENTLSNKNMKLFGQPIVKHDGDVLYHEIFIRMDDDKGENISPGVFVSMADRLGLNQPLDKFVILQATELMQSNADLRLAVNVSAYSMSNPSFQSWLALHFDTHPDLGEKLIFEITEQGLMQHMDQAKDFIALVHGKGSQVVMEHFGTRLSSFQALHQLKVDFVKMSGSYTRDIVNHDDHRFFLQTVSDIVHGLDMKMIAEQVETEDEAKVMEKLGVNMLQGYYFSAPKSI